MALMTQGLDVTNTIKRAQFTSAATEWLTKDTQCHKDTLTHAPCVPRTLLLKNVSNNPLRSFAKDDVLY